MILQNPINLKAIQTMMNIKAIIKLITSILLLGCILKMPYGYFQFIRLLGMTVFIWLAYIDSSKTNKYFLIIWVVSALLINPFIKVALGRSNWNIIDIVWAIILIISIWFDYKGLRDPKDG